MDIIQEIRIRIQPDTIIPKPAAKKDFVVKGWGKRRGQAALIYYIPNHKLPKKPYQKGITTDEWLQSYNHIKAGQDFTRSWFNLNMPECAAEGGCNFTTIGGIFELLGLVDHEYGAYKPRHRS